jgi:hypothetical protein
MRWSLAVAACVCLLPGCATIFNGGSQQTIKLAGQPPGATVTVTDRNGATVHEGVLPADLKLKRGAGYFRSQNYKITVSHPGFQDRTVPVRANVSAWYWGNILIGGALGMALIDPLTGGMFRLSPKKLDVSLQPVVTAEPAVAPAIP